MQASRKIVQMAVPISKALGLRMFVISNDWAHKRFLAMGVDQYSKALQLVAQEPINGKAIIQL